MNPNQEERLQPPRRPAAVAYLVVTTVVAIAFLVFVLPQPGCEETNHRNESVTARAIQPVGDLEGPPHMFIWTGDSTAARYSLEIFDAKGSRLHVVSTPDTFLATKGGLALPRVGSWRATALDDAGNEGSSTGIVEFSFP